MSEPNELNITYADFNLQKGRDQLLPSPVSFLLTHKSWVSLAAQVEHSVFLHSIDDTHEVWQATDLKLPEIPGHQLTDPNSPF
jgi:hypothetical protein